MADPTTRSVMHTGFQVTPPEPVEARDLTADPSVADALSDPAFRRSLDEGLVEARDLTAAIHAAFVEANGECVHFDRGFGPYAQCEDPGESVPVRWLASILAALRADTARVPEGLDAAFRLRQWAECVMRLMAVAPTSAVKNETGVRGGSTTPPERKAIREAAQRVVEGWLERDLAAFRADTARVPEPCPTCETFRGKYNAAVANGLGMSAKVIQNEWGGHTRDAHGDVP